MYNNPYFIPIYPTRMITPNLTRGLTSNLARNAATTSLVNTAKSPGLLSRLGSTISGIKAVNWSGLINNTSKTLGIINQTIPIVRQVGPMVNNMRSMFKVASLFKEETTPSININKTNNTNKTPTKTNPQQLTTYPQKKEEYNESPTFFLN